MVRALAMALALCFVGAMGWIVGLKAASLLLVEPF